VSPQTPGAPAGPAELQSNSGRHSNGVSAAPPSV
jgi:hypothetical protein